MPPAEAASYYEEASLHFYSMERECEFSPGDGTQGRLAGIEDRLKIVTRHIIALCPVRQGITGDGARHRSIAPNRAETECICLLVVDLLFWIEGEHEMPPESWRTSSRPKVHAEPAFRSKQANAYTLPTLPGTR